MSRPYNTKRARVRGRSKISNFLRSDERGRLICRLSVTMGKEVENLSKIDSVTYFINGSFPYYFPTDLS